MLRTCLDSNIFTDNSGTDHIFYNHRLRHSAHEAIRTRFERFSTPGRVRTTSWKQVLILMCALT